jgi:hypothetical protein
MAYNALSVDQSGIRHLFKNIKTTKSTYDKRFRRHKCFFKNLFLFNFGSA